jgi:hypothetical protein
MNNDGNNEFAIYTAQTAGGGGNRLQFSGNTFVFGYNLGAEGIRVSASGGSYNVGIGSFNGGTPGNRLTVLGNVGIGTNSSSAYALTAAPSGGMIVEKNVGIGSTAPGQVLDVQGTVRALGFTMGTNAPASGYVLTASDSAGDTTWTAPGTVSGWTVSGNNVYETLSGNVGIGTSTPQGSLVVTNGNVGIGTWAPKFALDVEGTTTLAYFNGNVGIGTTGLNKGYLLANTSGAGSALANAGAAGAWSSSAQPGDTILRSNAGSSLDLQSGNGSAAISINSSNNVGIGTTLPSAMLQLEGSDEVLNIENTDPLFSAGAVLQFGHNQGGSQLPVAKIRSYLINGAGAGNRGGNLIFSTSSLGVMSDQMTITSVGNVGIGTMLPQAKLAIANNVATGFLDNYSEYQEILYDGGSAGTSYGLGIKGNTMVFNSGVGAYSFDRGGSVTSMTLDANGNVGVGTTIPEAKLDVNGQEWIDAGSGGPLPAQAGRGLKMEYLSTLDVANFQAYDYSTSTVKNIIFELSGGSVGIGTFSPIGSFSVNSTSAQSVNRTSNIYVTSSNNTNQKLYIGIDSNAGATTNDFASIEYLQEGQHWGPLALQADGGNVGIGTNQPTSPLDVRTSVGSVWGTQVYSTGASSSGILGEGDVNGVEGISISGGSGAYGVYGQSGSYWAGLGRSDGYAIVGTGAAYFTTTTYSGAFETIGAGTNPATTDTPGVYMDTYLSVDRNGGPSLFVGRSQTGSLVNFYVNSVAKGSISVDGGGTTHYNAFTGSHYALLKGPALVDELIVLNGNNKLYHGAKSNEEVLYGVERSTKANDPAILGTYAERLENSQPQSVENPDLISAVGNGQMWVINTGPNLKPGDLFISSDVPGQAMLDPGTYPVSHIIARCGERVNWSQVTETINGRKHKSVSVFYEFYDKVNPSVAVAQVEKKDEEIKDLQGRVQQLEKMIFSRPRLEALEKKVSDRHG